MLEIVSCCCRPSSKDDNSIGSVQYSGRGSSCAEGRSEHSISVQMIVGGSLETNLSDFWRVCWLWVNHVKGFWMCSHHMYCSHVSSGFIDSDNKSHICWEGISICFEYYNSHFGWENISSKGGRIKSSQVISRCCQRLNQGLFFFLSSKVRGHRWVKLEPSLQLKSVYMVEFSALFNYCTIIQTPAFACFSYTAFYYLRLNLTEANLKVGKKFIKL